MGDVWFFMNQTITYWPPPAETGAGPSATFGSPVAMSGRWEDVQEKALDSQGREIMTKSIGYTENDVVNGGWLALGDHTATASPLDVDGAAEIRAFSKLPDIAAGRFIRKAVM